MIIYAKVTGELCRQGDLGLFRVDCLYFDFVPLVEDSIY
jgi:hypothetical protein